jgi:hypothetical protein
MRCQSLLPTFKLSCSFSYCWVLKVLWMFWIPVFYQMCLLQVFSTSLWFCLIIFLTLSILLVFNSSLKFYRRVFDLMFRTHFFLVLEYMSFGLCLISFFICCLTFSLMNTYCVLVTVDEVLDKTGKSYALLSWPEGHIYYIWINFKRNTCLLFYKRAKWKWFSLLPCSLCS